ncbi:MAG: hypothetical protein DMG65_00700 [Candidatus Angelobacter sp. Gp1-AA117]|nr:MAG: hypothetical protein DMG65_00700 [Candidatus Angelobacter sp. Gp1-AA117]
MGKPDPATFHKLYGAKKPRAVYYKKDFLDYLFMILLTIVVVGACYGRGHVITKIGLVLCAFMITMFAIRHGIEIKVPLILRKPQQILHTLAYKIQNLRPIYFVALGLLLLENILVTLTPNLPHHVALMRKIDIDLFYIELISITVFRTVILADHLCKRELVREVLMQTPWRRVVKEQTNITLEIMHAYCTGLLTHIITIAPWYLVIVYSRFSVIFLPVTILMSIVIHLKWSKVFNTWFYRDHWLGHNSEFEFIFLHGPHHDAIPSGMIAVAENGFLEGFMRFTIGAPIAFYSPFIAFLLYTIEVAADMRGHQYIPGLFPRLPKKVMETFQHSTHHYGPLEPYSIAHRKSMSAEGDDSFERWLPDEVRNSIELDEELTGFKWDNPTYRRTLTLWDKYQA